MALTTSEKDEKYEQLRRNEDPTLGELKALIDELGLEGKVKKNVGGKSGRKKADIRAEILEKYPDLDRPPLGELRRRRWPASRSSAQAASKA